MGLFDRLRLGARQHDKPASGTAVVSERDAPELINEGNALEDAGRFQDALERYDEAIRLAPTMARAHLNRGNALLALGDAEQAIAAYASALAHDPAYAATHYNLGNAYARAARREDAMAAYRRALMLQPEFADAEVALGALYEDLGQPEDAAASYRRALKVDAGYAAVHANLGKVLLELGRSEEAIVSYRRAIELDPELEMAHYGLGNALQGLEQHAEAANCYMRATKIRPDFALAHANLGNALRGLGKNEEAVASYRRALQIVPHQAAIYGDLGNALRNAGKIDEALAIFRRAVETEPDSAIAHYNLGNALKDFAQLPEAIASYRQALRLDSNYVDATCMLGNLLAEEGNLHDALACHRRMLEIDPQNVFAHTNIGNTFTALGRIADGIASHRLALAIKPDFTQAHNNLLFTLNFLADQPAAALLTDARRFGELVARRARAATTWSNLLDPDRPLRVGFVSGDFRIHPVGYFIEGVLAALASQASNRMELYAYSNHVFFDKVSARIKASCRAWYSASELSDNALAQRISDDGIDVLLDLSGHTANNRLPMFAWKPAPVQVSWLGYFATTGVAAIDYLIADAWTLPEAEEINFTEKIWRLPETRLCFTPPDEDVSIVPLGAMTNGYVTFGCFNKLTKVNDAVVALWSRVLAAVPKSRLFLKSKSIQEASVRQSIIERFAVHGVVADRLTLEGDSARADYLAAYQRVDIALDPFPYTGGTTTVEALWMGVPVLTLMGESFLARQGVGLLMNAGLPDWVAADADDYVARAVSHASDLARLAALRQELRSQVLGSPLFDAQRFARNFESALRGMWQLWCAQQHEKRRDGTI